MVINIVNPNICGIVGQMYSELRMSVKGFAHKVRLNRYFVCRNATCTQSRFYFYLTLLCPKGGFNTRLIDGLYHHTDVMA